MAKRFMGNFFRRNKAQHPATAHPANAHVPKKGGKPEFLRFVLKQLSYQSTYFPELTKTHNRMLAKMEFHKKTIPVITGNIKFDVSLARNIRAMLRLEQKINRLRLSVRKIASLDHAKAVADKARMLEAEFNKYKEANFLIFQKHFGPANGNAGHANGKKRRNGQ